MGCSMSAIFAPFIDGNMQITSIEHVLAQCKLLKKYKISTIKIHKITMH